MRNKHTAVLIEDEIEVREGMKQLLSDFCPELEILGEAGGIRKGLDLITKSQPEIVFLDVEMGDGTGIELAQNLPSRDFELIFVTAHEKYALDALRLASIGYLLKPVDPLELTDVVARAIQSLSSKESSQKLSILLENLNKPRNRKIVLRDQESLHIVPVEDILYLQADGSYCHFYLKGNRVLTISSHMKPYVSALEGVFGRPHNSYLVNLEQVKRFDKQEGGKVIISNDIEIPVSRRRKDDFLQQLEAYF